MIDKKEVKKQLKTVIDPELHINILDLGLIYEIDINNSQGLVEITMTLTTPGCPLSHIFEEVIPEAIKKIPEVKEVKINLTWEPPWDPDKMSDEVKEEMGIIR